MRLMEKFPLIEVTGKPEELGHAHGESLRERIEAAFSFYRDLFKRFNDSQIIHFSNSFKKNISLSDPDYETEIEAIARASGLDPWKVYMLNARTEIHRCKALAFGENDVNECTSFFFKESAVLAQNWDWEKTLEDLSVVIRLIRRDGHRILMVTEPGIIGKIGFNSAGVGVCLNILRCEAEVGGLPVHVLLRKVLDSSYLREAFDKVLSSKRATMSNMLLADRNGEGFNIELAGDRLEKIESSGPVVFHTNHYMGCGLADCETGTQSSYERLKRAKTLLLNSSYDVESAKSILADQNPPELPICRPFETDSDEMVIGTLCSIIMDLRNKKMILSKGNPLHNEFAEIDL